MIFSSMLSFMDRATGYLDTPLHAADHTKHWNLFDYSIFRPCSVISLSTTDYNVKGTIQKLKADEKKTFSNFKDVTQHILRFHVNDHIVKIGSKFRLLDYLDASSHSYFIFIHKTFIKATSVTNSSTLKKALELLNSSTFHIDIFELRVDPSERTVLATKGYKTGLAYALQSWHQLLQVR